MVNFVSWCWVLAYVQSLTAFVTCGVEPVFCFDLHHLGLFRADQRWDKTGNDFNKANGVWCEPGDVVLLNSSI